MRKKKGLYIRCPATARCRSEEEKDSNLMRNENIPGQIEIQLLFPINKV